MSPALTIVDCTQCRVASCRNDIPIIALTGGAAMYGTGLAAVGQLNSIMKNKYARDPENLRAWLSASHTERAPRRA